MAVTHSIVQRSWFIDAMLADTGGEWPDLEVLLTAIYTGYVRPADVVIDVGVNRGMHLVRLALLVGAAGRVIGVEAVPAFADVARMRLAAEAHELEACVELHECAVAAETGRSDFFVTSITDGGLSGLRLRPVIAGEPFDRIRVDTRTLDSLLPDRPVRFVKIDIEGGEYDALRGAPLLLAQRPLIAFEFNGETPADFGFHPEDLFDLLTSSGYRVHDIFGFEVDSAEAMSTARVWNFLAVPPGVDPHLVTMPARELLEADHPVLAGFAPGPPPPPDFVEALRQQGGFRRPVPQWRPSQAE